MFNDWYLREFIVDFIINEFETLSLVWFSYIFFSTSENYYLPTIGLVLSMTSLLLIELRRFIPILSSNE